MYGHAHSCCEDKMFFPKTQAAAKRDAAVPALQRANGNQRQNAITVSQPNDRYEREADAVAAQIMREPSGASVPAIRAVGGAEVQRKCAQCEEEETGMIQRKADTQAAAPVTDGIDAALSGGGRALSASERGFFEPRFGRDFSQVKLHSGAPADNASRALQARAFTFQNHIVLGHGEYQPHSDSGRHLLAHELTHVVQQQAVGAGVMPMIMPYRKDSKKTPFFNKADPIPGLPKSAAEEQELTDKTNQPYVERISIHFDKLECDTQTGCAIPTGTLKAQYKNNKGLQKYQHFMSVPNFHFIPGVGIVNFPIPVTWNDLTPLEFPVAGGSVALGLTDVGPNQEVCKIRAQGYVSGSLRAGISPGPTEEWKYGKQYIGVKGSEKPSFGNMDFAVFFKLPSAAKCVQAVHGGALDEGSHSCVHAGVRSGSAYDAALLAKLQQLNYHSQVGLTKVDVTYDSTVLFDLCAHRYHVGDGRINGNPCSGIGSGSKDRIKKIKAKYPTAASLKCSTCT